MTTQINLNNIVKDVVEHEVENGNLSNVILTKDYANIIENNIFKEITTLFDVYLNNSTITNSNDEINYAEEFNKLINSINLTPEQLAEYGIVLEDGQQLSDLVMSDEEEEALINAISDDEIVTDSNMVEIPRSYDFEPGQHTIKEYTQYYWGRGFQSMANSASNISKKIYAIEDSIKMKIYEIKYHIANKNIYDKDSYCDIYLYLKGLISNDIASLVNMLNLKFKEVFNHSGFGSSTFLYAYAAGMASGLVYALMFSKNPDNYRDVNPFLFTDFDYSYVACLSPSIKYLFSKELSEVLKVQKVMLNHTGNITKMPIDKSICMYSTEEITRQLNDTIKDLCNETNRNIQLDNISQRFSALFTIDLGILIYLFWWNPACAATALAIVAVMFLVIYFASRSSKQISKIVVNHMMFLINMINTQLKQTVQNISDQMNQLIELHKQYHVIGCKKNDDDYYGSNCYEQNKQIIEGLDYDAWSELHSYTNDKYLIKFQLRIVTEHWCNRTEEDGCLAEDAHKANIAYRWETPIYVGSSYEQHEVIMCPYHDGTNIKAFIASNYQVGNNIEELDETYNDMPVLQVTKKTYSDTAYSGHGEPVHYPVDVNVHE